jgi:hypothetical protein
MKHWSRTFDRRSQHFVLVSWAGSSPLKRSPPRPHRTADLAAALTVDPDYVEVNLARSKSLPSSWATHWREEAAMRVLDARSE